MLMLRTHRTLIASELTLDGQSSINILPGLLAAESFPEPAWFTTSSNAFLLIGATRTLFKIGDP